MGASLAVPRVRGRALLAQLVEHFHGKEGVAGSSPAEGFWQEDPANQHLLKIGPSAGLRRSGVLGQLEDT